MAERCIVKILGKSAKSFAACFYNEGKVAEGSAKCIEMRNFGGLQKYFIHSPVVLSNYLQKIADHNSRVGHKQKHMVFSFPGKATQEQIEQLLKDAAETMDRLGYKGQPQVFWVHNDTDNTHIHVVSVTVSVKDGMWIDNYQEGRRARRILDQLRGQNYKSEIDKLLEYKFESREQFKSLLLANGCRCHLDEENGCYDIYRNHDLVASLPTDEIDKVVAANGRNKDNHKDVIKDLRGKLMDNRRRSLDLKINEPIVVTTKKGKHVVTSKLSEVKGSRFNGEKGLDIDGERKAQFKQFLVDLKQKLGISIVFSQWKDGQTKGYTIIDNKNKMVFKGSDVVDLQKLLNPEWKKGMEKDAVISANDASSMADEISMDKNLPQFIEQQLEKMGVEVNYDKEGAMSQYGSDSEQENREKAVNCFNLLKDMIANQEDLTEEGEQEVNRLATEAIGRAICADSQHLQEEEQKAREKAEEEARRSEQEKSKERAEAAKTMTADRVASYVIDIIDDYNIPHDPGGHEFTSIDRMKEDDCLQKAIKCLEDAITGDRQFSYGRANLAIGYARAAEQLHQRNIEEQQRTVAEKPRFVLPSSATLDTIDKVLENALKDLGYTGLKGVKIPAGFDLKDYTPDRYANRSLEFLREAYRTSGEERKQNLLNALNAANMAHEQHRRMSAASQTVKPKPTVKPVVPKIRPISFTGFTASVTTKGGRNYITATVAGKNMEKALSAGHYAWYQQEPDKTEAARGLALHYFSQEFYLAKREEYKQQCIANGKLPYDIKLSNVRSSFGKVYGRIDYPDKDWDNNCGHKFSEKDRLSGETDKDLFIRKFGSEEADNFWGHSFGDIRDFFIDKPAEFEDSKAIGETLAVLSEVAAAFNDSMATMFNVVLGNNAGYVPSCGGGGGNNSLSKKKDDDWMKNPRNLFMKPVRGRGLKRR